MGSLADRKTLTRCLEQLEEKVTVDQHYRSSERGKAGITEKVSKELKQCDSYLIV